MTSARTVERHEFDRSGRVRRLVVDDDASLQRVDLRTTRAFVDARALSVRQVTHRRVAPLPANRVVFAPDTSITAFEGAREVVVTGQPLALRVPEDATITTRDGVERAPGPDETVVVHGRATRWDGRVQLDVSLPTGEPASLVCRPAGITWQPAGAQTPPLAEATTARWLSDADGGGAPGVSLDPPLTGCFDPITVRVLANVVRASQGRGLQRDVLGSGQAGIAGQTFRLAGSPLTYRHRAESPGWESTVEIRVDGVRWREVASLHDQGPRDRVFTVREEEEGTTVVAFGDGVHGARLPSGRDNVVAVYRTGWWPDPVAADHLTVLESAPPGVEGVTNPRAVTAAAPAETVDQTRERAPRALRTLGRIVSLSDYEDFCHDHPLVAQARVERVSTGEGRLVHVTLVSTDGAPLAGDPERRAALVEAIEASRADRTRLSVADARQVRCEVAATVAVDPDRRVGEVEREVRAQLARRYATGPARFGQRLTASEVAAVIRQASGVQAVEVTALHRASEPASLHPWLEAAPARWDPSTATVRPAEQLRLSPRGRVAGDDPMTDEARPGLYELLPAYVRYRDQVSFDGAPLRELMTALQAEYDALRADVDRLYDDWFVETCQDHLVPLLGDLLGVRGLDVPERWVPGQRTRVANALAYRRLKGTPSVLERVVRDVTGWPTVVVPLRERLARTRSLTHDEEGDPRTGALVDLRDRVALARRGGPFDRLARSVRVSRRAGPVPTPGPDRSASLDGLGLFVWRVPVSRLRERSARALGDGRYTLHPFGCDQALFRRPERPGPLDRSLDETQIPAAVTRERLVADLARAVSAPAGAEVGPADGDRLPVVVIDPDDGEPVDPARLDVADLSDWVAPASWRASGRRQGRVAVDPELGRLLFASAPPAGADVRVTQTYGGAGAIGGGPYERPTVEPVSPELTAPRAGGRFQHLQAAIDAWPHEEHDATIQITDSRLYGRDPHDAGRLEVALTPGATLTLSAAAGTQPCLAGDLRVTVRDGGREGASTRLVLDGLLVDGLVDIEAPPDGQTLRIDVRHCTLRPGGNGPAVRVGTGGQGGRVDVDVRASIVGRLTLPDGTGRLHVADSILDHVGGWSLSGGDDGVPAGSVELTRTTVLGRLVADELVADDTVFAAPVRVRSRGRGGLRHCYVPETSETPRRERCEPSDAPETAGAPTRPSFASRRYGQPGYGRLSWRCAAPIRHGGRDGGEMGAFAGEGAPAREANLRDVLAEYAPQGLTPHVVYVT